MNEAVKIQISNADVLLNDKAEWHGPATVRLQAEAGILREWQIQPKNKLSELGHTTELKGIV